MGPSLAEVLEHVLPEDMPPPTEQPSHSSEGQAEDLNSHARFRAITAEVRESSLHEACGDAMRLLSRSDEAPLGSEAVCAPGTQPNLDIANVTAFEDIAEPIDARDQHVPAPAIAKTAPVILAAPGYPLEIIWVGLDIPATVSQLCSDVRDVGSSLFGEIGDCLTPTHPQLEIGVASFIVTPPWFPEANLAAVLVDARAVQGTVFSVVLSYPTSLEEIHRAVGFMSVAEHEVYAAGDNEPLVSGRPILAEWSPGQAPASWSCALVGISTCLRFVAPVYVACRPQPAAQRIRIKGVDPSP